MSQTETYYYIWFIILANVNKEEIKNIYMYAVKSEFKRGGGSNFEN